jgi:hypothetical protein
MQFYTNLKDFVTASRSNSVKAASARNLAANSAGEIWENRSKSAAVELPKEGLSAILTGYHLYAMLQLRPGLTTSSSNEDRKKNIALLGELVQGAREVSHRYEGALLEAQGPVVHIFLPDDDGAPKDARTAAMEVHEFIDDRIRKKAGSDFLKALVAYSRGPSILVNAEDSHGDESIVSLAPAANAPAKVLWKNWESLPTGAILEVNTEGNYREINEDDRRAVLQKSAGVIFNASRNLRDVMLVEASAADRMMPVADSPESPTVEEPLRSFSISFRADIEGFTRKVSTAFHVGTEAVQELAQEFYQIMAHARSFCTGKECIHLPWAGDCFNLLLSFEEREPYQSARQRRILTIALEFIRHMQDRFPDLGWAVSLAGGELESAQVCNTLVSRITVGHTTLLLATGLPVERSLQGIVRKGDVSQLAADLQNAMDPAKGGENYRHFKVDDIERAQDAYDFVPPPSPYKSSLVPKAVAALAPIVKPHFE